MRDDDEYKECIVNELQSCNDAGVLDLILKLLISSNNTNS